MTSPRRPAAVPGTRAAKRQNTADTATAHEQRLAAAERDRDALRFELDAAHERVADLERRQAEIAKRIASVLKSLHNLSADCG